MLMQPSKLLLKKILKNRTINFETVRRTHGNLVFIGSDSKEDMSSIVKSKLFRPQQLMSSFVPRIIRPMNKKTVILDQKELYKEIRIDSGNKLKIGKIMIDAYNEKNLVYNMIPEYNETYKIADKIKTGLVLQKYMTEFFEETIKGKIDLANYDKNYIVFPLNGYISDFKNKVFVNMQVINPLVLFLKSIRKGTIDPSAYSRVHRIIFYNPNAKAMVVMDPSNFDFEKDFMDFFIKVERLNKFNNKEDDLIEDVLDESDEKLDEEEEAENTKEKIKEIVLGNVAKALKSSKLDDFEAATKDEKDIILLIDRKVEEYLDSKENESRSFSDLVSAIETDPEIKVNALKYVETKKMADQKMTDFSKNLEKEVEQLNSIGDLALEEKTITPDRFEVDFVDEAIKESYLSNIDEEYNKKQSSKDLKAIISSFSGSSYLPMTIDSATLDDTSDDFNQINTLHVRYKTEDGKKISFTLDIPKVVDKRYFFLNGNKKVMTKQLARLPIVKTKPERVEITTNFNKITIERTNGKVSRRNAYLLKILEGYKNNSSVKIEYGSNGVVNNKYKNDFEYEELSEEITSIEGMKYKVIFNREEMQAEIDLMELPESYFGETTTPLALDKIKEFLIIIRDEKIYEVKPDKSKPIETLVSDSIFDFILEKVLGREPDQKLPQIGKSFVYTKMKIFGESYPVFAVAGLLNGITDILKRYKVDHKFSEKKISKNGEYVEVRFKDGYFYYKDIIRNTLLLNVLYTMNTEDFNYSDFDLDQPYLDFFIEKMDQPIYIKNTLRINMNIFLDPITKDVLKDLKLPTDIIDLLLLSNTMLTSNSYRPQNDIRNFRVRGNEVVYAIMYKIVAEAYMRYQAARLNGRHAASLDIPRNKLISTLSQQPNVNDHSTLNPVLEMESIASISAKGHSGINLDDAFTLELRAYDESMVGIISPNSTPQGNAGVARSLSYNPKISSIRGYIPTIDMESLNPANILSPAEMLQSFTSTQADPIRQSMQIGQTKHTMPVVKTHKQLIGSGINKTMAFMISDDFAFKAKEDGYIEKIDDENKLVILRYDSGAGDAIDLGESFAKNSNSGFFIRQQFKLVFKEGQKFKAKDVIAYNPSFFSGKGKDVDYQPGTLAKVAIATGDFAFEDSTVISSSVAEKAASLVTMMKPVSLGPNTVIHNIVGIGKKVKAGDTLLDFTTSFEDPSTTEFLASLSKSLGDEAAQAVGNEKITSKYTGTIVDVKIYYNKPIDELNETLQKLIKKYKSKVQKRKNALGNIKTANIHIPPVDQQKSDRVGVEEYEGVLIEFYTEFYDEMGEGDKLVFSTALKGVISQVIPNSEAPLTEYRKNEPVEAIITPTGIISRMTMDIYSMLFGNKVLVELGKQIKEIMDDEG